MPESTDSFRLNSTQETATMARSIHPRYTAADRYERRARRRPRITERRQGTRAAVVRRAFEEV